MLASSYKRSIRSFCSSKGPLDGIKVLDMSRILAGPYCSMILGDMGAEVYKVNNPTKFRRFI